MPRPRIHRLSLAVTAAAVALAVLPTGAFAQAATAAETATPVTAAAETPPPGAIVSSNGLWAVLDDLVSSVLDYEHPTLTVTGRLRLYDPVAKTYAVSGGSAFVSFEALTRSSTVAADGTFTVSVPTSTYLRTTPWTASLSWSPDAATRAAFGQAFGRAFATWSVAATPSSWRFVMDQPNIRVKEGPGVVLSGTVERLVGGVWTPKPDVVVRVGSELLPATTNAEGRFSIGFFPTGDVTAQVEASDGHRLFTTYASRPVGNVHIDVIPTSKLTVNSTAVTASRLFRARGQLSYNTNAAAPAKVSVRLQRSLDGRTGWSTLRTIQTELNGTYADDIQLGTVSGYYRLVFPESSRIQGSQTPVFRLSRTETRIGHLSITPRKIDKGDRVRFSGVVQKRIEAGTYSRLGKQVKVTVTYRRSLSDTPEVVTRRWTNSVGEFSFKKRVTKAGYWTVKWVSTSTYLVNASGPERRIRFS